MGSKSKLVAVRCFRSEAAMGSGKRGRRLVIDATDGGVFHAVTDGAAGLMPGLEEDPVVKGVDPSTIKTVDELALALGAGRTPHVLEDPALTDYVNVNGFLPREGLPLGAGLTEDEYPDDFVDARPEAVTRRERIAAKAAA